jgi:alpha-L-rhamnosidase
MYGHTESQWNYGDDEFTLRVTIPPNATATVWVPDAANREVTESGLPVSQASGVSGVEVEGGDVVIRIGSGQYTFITRN